MKSYSSYSEFVRRTALKEAEKKLDNKSEKELIEKLIKQGYETSEERHHADLYYVLKVRVANDTCDIKEMDASWLNSKNGNDTYSPHSPKMFWLLD